jgi:predicted nucleic acid-binding protein
VYADTSFLVKLFTRETGTDSAVAEYRRLGRPALPFLPLHALEVENAIRLKSYHQRRSLPAAERSKLKQEETAALARVRHFIDRGVLLEVSAEWEAALNAARDLSQRHTSSMGARSLDLLHLGFALQLEAELFLTTDECQGKVAALAGFELVLVRG